METLNLLKMVVAGYSRKSMTPEIKTFMLECSDDEIKDGSHHIRAHVIGFDSGLHARESIVVFDATSPAGQFLINAIPAANWETAKVFKKEPTQQ